MKLRYNIYQIDLERPGAERVAFRPYVPCGDGPAAVDSDPYTLAYSGELTCEDDWNTFYILERLFHVLNVEHPADYRARSLSVSDVVALPGEDGERFYYCDTIGFRQVAFAPRGGASAGLV